MEFLRRLSSHASRRTRLCLAAATWSGVGLTLFVLGVHWVLLSPFGWDWAAGLGALAVGWAKGRFVLARAAEANARRIEGSDHHRFIGAAFSVGMWAMAVAMMALGAWLRHSHLSRFWLGLIYVAVGTALVLGSLVSWSHWRRLPRSRMPRNRRSDGA